MVVCTEEKKKERNERINCSIVAINLGWASLNPNKCSYVGYDSVILSFLRQSIYKNKDSFKLYFSLWFVIFLRYQSSRVLLFGKIIISSYQKKVKNKTNSAVDFCCR
jgi:hypothetical protein